MYKKAWCTCKVVVLPIKPIASLPFSLTSPSSLLKLPNVWLLPPLATLSFAWPRALFQLSGVYRQNSPLSRQDGNWAELTFAKTSGRIRSNDPRNNCGAHFGSSLLLDSKVASTTKVIGSYAAAKQGLPGQEVKKYLHVGYPLTSCSLHRFVSVAQSTAPIAPSTLFSVFTFLAAEEYSGLIFLQCGHPSVIKTTDGSS